jgi:hypothetical protein
VKMARATWLCGFVCVPVMVERNFVVLRYEGKVPTMASLRQVPAQSFHSGPVRE